MSEHLYLIALGAVAMWLIGRFIADHRAGIWDRDRARRLDITTALARHRRLEQLAVERRALEVEDQIIRDQREAS